MLFAEDSVCLETDSQSKIKAAFNNPINSVKGNIS